MHNISSYISVLVVLSFVFFSGCQTSGAVGFERIDEEHPRFFHITDIQFSMYSEKVQNAFQKTSTIIVTEHEIEDFLNISTITPNRRIVCNNKSINTFRGYINYDNEIFLISMSCNRANNLTISFSPIKRMAYAISENELEQLPIFSQKLQSNTPPARLPRNEWDILWGTIGSVGYTYIQCQYGYFEIYFMT
jgi:hypothetical protein